MIWLGASGQLYVTDDATGHILAYGTEREALDAAIDRWPHRKPRAVAVRPPEGFERSEASEPAGAEGKPRKATKTAKKRTGDHA